MYGTNIVLKIKCAPIRSSLISEWLIPATVEIETIFDDKIEVNSIDITCFRSHFLGKTFIL